MNSLERMLGEIFQGLVAILHDYCQQAFQERAPLMNAS
jgi:hypothetical protein